MKESAIFSYKPMNDRRISHDEVVSSLVNLHQLTFEVTDACNLQCKYCGYGDLYFGYDKRETNYLSFERGKAMLDYLADIWRTHAARSARPRTYISFYGGEPLMNMPFIERMVAYVESLDIRRNFIFSMTTNAMLLDRYMNYLREKKVRLLISLDGDRQGQSYRVTHSGENSFDRVFANVKKLQRTYPGYFEEYVQFNSVLHNRNSVERTFDFIKREFGKRAAITELNNSGIKPEKVEEFNRTYRNMVQSLHESENYERISDEMFMSEPDTHDLLLYLHQYSGNVFRDYNALFVDDAKIAYTPTGTCSPFSKKMFVTVNGKILQCERIDHRFALGQLSEAGVELDIDAIVARFNGYLDKLQRQCTACHRKKSCIQCMYYIENLDDPQPQCHGYMNRETFDRYSSHCLGHLSHHPHLYRKLMEEVQVE